MNKKQNKKMNKYEAISMLTYLRDFLGVTEQLSTLKKATHKDIKWIGFENSVPVPFDYVDNDDLARGNIVLVIDSQKHIAPYQNPLRIKEQQHYIKKKHRGGKNDIR